MKAIANILAFIGVFLVIYAVIGRFVGASSIGLGIIVIHAKSGLILANSFILISLLIKSSIK